MSNSPTILPVILSGGAGTRLWPTSRAEHPKQLMPLLGEDTLLQATLKRVGPDLGFKPALVLCNEEHRFMVAEQARAAKIALGAIIVEPVARNTAPAACIAALKALVENDEALLLILPSDHHITDNEAFRLVVEEASRAAAAGYLVTFGVKPWRPETGYGYIEIGEPLEATPPCLGVSRFVEKPHLETAEGYLDSGNFLWNSGIFLFSARALLEEMERLQPQILESCRAALENASQDADFLRLGKAEFAVSPSQSLDYAIMEKTNRAAVAAVDFGWTDLGSWGALWEVMARDDAGNAAQGDVVALDSTGNLFFGTGRLVAAIGVQDLVVVESADAILVCPRNRTQEIKRLVAELEARGRPERLSHRRVYRPWGSFEGIDAGKRFQVKRLVINPGASISMQRHRRRAEHWIVVSGVAEVTRAEEVFRLAVNQSTYIPLGVIHRLSNPGTEPLHIIEVQSGDYLGEDDIERFEDVYGRT